MLQRIMLAGITEPICEKCEAIDKRIQRLEILASRISGQQRVDGAAGLIAELRRQKVTFHPERASEK
jgi:hypothetical protein